MMIHSRFILPGLTLGVLTILSLESICNYVATIAYPQATVALSHVAELLHKLLFYGDFQHGIIV